MLNLNKPSMADQTFRREFSSKLDFLSGKTSFIEVRCKAGGWMNPALLKLREEVELHSNIKRMQIAEELDDKEKFTRLSTELNKEVGKMQFDAIYDGCVVEWKTNIVNNGKPMVCDKEHFMALADVRSEEIATYFVDFAKFIDDLANFINKADEETEKN